MLSDLHKAASEGDLETFRHLVSNGQDVNLIETTGGAQPIHYAVAKGRTNIVKYLMEKGADKTVRALGTDWIGSCAPAEILAQKSDLYKPVDQAVLTFALYVPILGRTIFYMRHAQSLNNMFSIQRHRQAVHGILDALLSDTGIQQVTSFHKQTKSWLHTLGIDLIVVSPLSRAIQTCLYAFGELSIAKNIPILVDPRITERIGAHCDIGRVRSEIEKDFVHPNLRYQDLPQVWWYTDASKLEPRNRMGTSLEPEDYTRKRLDSFELWLKSRTEKFIVVVCHGGIMNALFNKTADNLHVYSRTFLT